MASLPELFIAAAAMIYVLPVVLIFLTGLKPDSEIVKFDSLLPHAATLANFNDTIAERAVTLGGKAFGTVRHVAKVSRIGDYPQETTRDLEHVKLLAERFEAYLAELRGSRSAAEGHTDTDTVDLFTTVITEFEKNAWFLRASLEC